MGVSPTIRQTSLRPDVEALVYLPFRQFPTFWFSIMARVRAPASAANALREEVGKLDPDLPLLNVRTIDEYLDRLRGETRVLQHAVFRVCATRSPSVRCWHLRRPAYATSRGRRRSASTRAVGAATGDVVWLVLGWVSRALRWRCRSARPSRSPCAAVSQVSSLKSHQWTS